MQVAGIVILNLNAAERLRTRFPNLMKLDIPPLRSTLNQRRYKNSFLGVPDWTGAAATSPGTSISIGKVPRPIGNKSSVGTV
jgi:hypothetical protein